MQFLLILNEELDTIDSAESRAAAAGRTGEYVMGLAAEGKVAGGAQLRPHDEAKRIRRREANTEVIDGPFAEAKEVIGGFLIIEAASLEEAVALASACPNAEFGSVEVRELVPMG